MSEEIVFTADDLQTYLALYGMETCCRMIEEKFQKIRLSKIDALFKLYDIDPKEPKRKNMLLGNLILRHVPGFQVNIDQKTCNVMAGKKLSPGRPAKTSTLEYELALYWLLNQYDQINSKKELVSKTNICRLIKKRKDFPQVLLSGCKLPSLRRLSQHLNIALDRRNVLIRDAFVEAMMAGNAKTEGGEKLIDHAEE